jgi:hypothetical protein
MKGILRMPRAFSNVRENILASRRDDMTEDRLKTWKDIESAIQEHSLVDEDFREELIADPKATLEKYLETPLPVDLQVAVHINDISNLHITIPAKLSKTELDSLELSEEQLEMVAGGEGAITTAIYATTVAISVALSYTANDQTRHRFGW